MSLKHDVSTAWFDLAKSDAGLGTIGLVWPLPWLKRRSAELWTITLLVCGTLQRYLWHRRTGPIDDLNEAA